MTRRHRSTGEYFSGLSESRLLIFGCVFHSRRGGTTARLAIEFSGQPGSCQSGFGSYVFGKHRITGYASGRHSRDGSAVGLAARQDRTLHACRDDLAINPAAGPTQQFVPATFAISTSRTARNSRSIDRAAAGRNSALSGEIADRFDDETRLQACAARGTQSREAWPNTQDGCSCRGDCRNRSHQNGCAKRECGRSHRRSVSA